MTIVCLHNLLTSQGIDPALPPRGASCVVRLCGASVPFLQEKVVTLPLAGVDWLVRVFSPNDLYPFRPHKRSALLGLMCLGHEAAGR